MKSFATINEIIKAMHSCADDAPLRMSLSLIHRKVNQHIHDASGLEETELNEEYPLFQDNEHLFEDYIGGKVIYADVIEDLEGLKGEATGNYLLDVACYVGDSLVGMALITNNAGGDWYFVPRKMVEESAPLNLAVTAVLDQEAFA